MHHTITVSHFCLCVWGLSCLLSCRVSVCMFYLFCTSFFYSFLALVHKHSLLYLISIFCIFCLPSFRVQPPPPPPLSSSLIVCLFSVSTFLSSLSVLFSLSFTLTLLVLLSFSPTVFLSHCLLSPCLHLLVFHSFSLSSSVYLSPCLPLLVFISFSCSTSFHLSFSFFLSFLAFLNASTSTKEAHQVAEL